MKTRFLPHLLITALLFCTGSIASAQQQDFLTKKEVKTYDKSVKYYKKAQDAKGDKVTQYYDKAIVTLQPVLLAHVKMEDLWTTMIEYYYSRYSFEARVYEWTKLIIKSGMKNAKNAEEKAIYQNYKIDTTKMHDYKMSLLDMC